MNIGQNILVRYAVFCSISFGVLVTFQGSIRAGQEALPTPQSLSNIALGKTYTLDPQPNYQYTIDPGDIKQLTDGRYTSGHFWTQKSTVGWMEKKYATITIDLGAVHAIKGVSYNMAAGVAGVQWPSGIYIFVSDDGRYFYEAGELINLSRKGKVKPISSDGTYQIHRYWTDELSTHGRYLSLVVLERPFIFTDEIEVYEGETSYCDLPYVGKPISDSKALGPQKLINKNVIKRLDNDIQVIRGTLLASSVQAEAGNAISARIEAVEEELHNTPHVMYGEEFRAVLPLNALHERIFHIQAELWRTVGLPKLSLWQSGPWDSLRPIHMPSKEPTPSVQMDMMLNEYRSGTFNISNASDRENVLLMEIIGLPGGTNPAYIRTHEVVWTGTSGGECVASALAEAEKKDGAFLLHIPSGMTIQVWFTFHPTAVPPGVYEGRILLSGGEKQLELPLVLHIYPLHFPDQPMLHVGGWDYTEREGIFDITPQNIDKVVDHLKEHFVDSPWANSLVLPFESLAKNGDYHPDTGHFDTWLHRWPDARQYCVFMNVRNGLSGFAMETPEFAEKVKHWITFWANYLQSRGLDPNQLLLLLVDEPNKPDQDETIIHWARAIRAANTGVKIWEDPIHKNPSTAKQEMMRLCDVLCPERVDFLNAFSSYRNYFVQRQKEGTELAFYSAKGPASELDPYTYYRLQAWTCWQYGALSSYFWAFSDAGGGSSWNEYGTDKIVYTPFFLDAEILTPSKQMEAIREGVEDYEYLMMLRHGEKYMQRNGLKPDLLKHLRELLDEAQEVGGIKGPDSFLWKTERDRTAADRLRIKILGSLSELQNIQRVESTATIR